MNTIEVNVTFELHKIDVFNLFIVFKLFLYVFRNIDLFIIIQCDFILLFDQNVNYVFASKLYIFIFFGFMQFPQNEVRVLIPNNFTAFSRCTKLNQRF